MAIKSLVLHRTEYRSAQLSYNDLFYKDVTRIHQVITALVSIEENKINESAPEEVPTIVRETTEIILAAFAELAKLQTLDKFGQFKKFLLQPLFERPNSISVIPWHVQSTVLDQLSKQADLIVSACSHIIELDVKGALFGQLEQLTDVILDGLKLSLESLKGSDRYNDKLESFEVQRAKLLSNLVQIDADSSLALAEKYLDFDVLVSVCYMKKDLGRIEHFFDKYSALGFSTYTFEWYLKQRKTSELIETFSLSNYQNELKEFLKAYPEVGWHHAAVIEDFQESAAILKGLADKEEARVDDKKFFLCMAKLGVLASASSDNVVRPRDAELFHNVNKDLKIIEYQNELSDEVVKKFGLERRTMRTLNPSELIDMYSSREVEPDTINFMKALELCEFVGVGFRDEKRFVCRLWLTFF